MIFDLLNSEYEFGDGNVIVFGDDKPSIDMSLLSISYVKTASELTNLPDLNCDLLLFCPGVPINLLRESIKRVQCDRIIIVGDGSGLPIRLLQSFLKPLGFGIDLQFTEFLHTKIKSPNLLDAVQFIRGGFEYFPGLDFLSQKEVATNYFLHGVANYAAPTNGWSNTGSGFHWTPETELSKKKSVRLVLRLEGILRNSPILFKVIRFSVVGMVRVARRIKAALK